MNVRDAFYEVLRTHGITTIFGNPGSNELPMLSDLPADFRYILALQEGAAIGMADGYAQATGRPSLVNLHAAAGTGNAMGNLVNTQAGHVPVIVTSGQQARQYTELKAYLTNVDAVNAAKTDSTVFAHEWTSTMVSVWDRLEITRPGSMYLSAGGGLGWGLPGAIGLQLADPSRRVVSLLGDGAVHYSVSGLWTAARHSVPVVFVVARNSEYRALKEFSRFMHDPDAPGMELPDMDIPGVAAAYGVQSETVKSLADLTHAVKDGLLSDQPRLIEISQRRIGDS